jgi:hypothetical protein
MACKVLDELLFGIDTSCGIEARSGLISGRDNTLCDIFTRLEVGSLRISIPSEVESRSRAS